jgi:serine/threonine protein kinase/Leucine-rich repeat (LRR) protein
MLKFNAKTKVSPQRRAAEELLAQLKPTLEMEAGRGSITVNHYLTCRNSPNEEDLYPYTTPGTGFYTIENVVATGGMGAILRAFDNNLQRTVALKVMLNSADAGEAAIYSFVAEAQITGQLEHPNIVPLHDIGVSADGTIYYTMKLISGRTLREILKEIRDGVEETIERFSIGRLLTVFQKLCDGIAYAHSQNVIHRDLKPDNVMVGEFGEVLILDWGLAKVLSAEGDAHEAATEGDEFDAELPDGETFGTLAGQVKGTPNYMAPEQAEGRVEDIDNRTDVYALGGIMYAILTLHPPITGSNLDEILTKVTSSQITPPLNYNNAEVQNPTGLPAPHCPEGKIPTALSAVSMKCMAYDSDDRYMYVESLQGDIAAYQGGYATAAEDAGLFTQLKLLIQRNKKEVFFIFLIIGAIIATGASFMAKVTHSNNQAQKQKEKALAKIEELKESAPAFLAAAEGHIYNREFSNALNRINYAIDLDSEIAQFHNIRGDIYLTTLEISAAITNYAQALDLDPAHKEAKANREICNSVRTSLKEGAAENTDLFRAALRNLNTYLIREGRNSEAFHISKMLVASDDRLLDGYNKRIWRTGLPETLVRNSSREFFLNLDGLTNASIDGIRGIPLTELSLVGAAEISDISAVDQMPLKKIILRDTPVSDLTPIRSLKDIQHIDLSGCKELADLGPIQGMTNITWLDISGTAVDSLEPLVGMNLTHLDISGTSIKDLKWLEAMDNLTYFKADECTRVSSIAALKNGRLETFSASGSRIRSIAALKGENHTLRESVGLARTFVRDLSPLAGKQIVKMDLFKGRMEDISALAGMPLEWLDLREMPISNIDVLQGMPFDVLRLANTKITNIDPIRGAPLREELDLTNTKITDITALAASELQNVSLAKTSILSLKPLSGLPLHSVRLDGLTTKPDLNPLWDCKETLVNLSIPFPSLTVIKLRRLPVIKRLTYTVRFKESEDVGYKQDVIDWSGVDTPERFWKDFARRFPNIDR